ACCIACLREAASAEARVRPQRQRRSTAQAVTCSVRADARRRTWTPEGNRDVLRTERGNKTERIGRQSFELADDPATADRNPYCLHRMRWIAGALVLKKARGIVPDLH